MGADFAIITPEIILALAAMALLMFGAYGGGDRRSAAILWISAALMAGLGWCHQSRSTESTPRATLIAVRRRRKGAAHAKKHNLGDSGDGLAPMVAPIAARLRGT